MSDDLLDLFIEESRDLVLRAQDDILALEAQPTDAARLDDLFRAVHTLKGSVAFFDWPFFGRMLHAAEDLMSAVRAGEKPFDGVAVQALDACINQTESFLAALAAHRALPADGEARTIPITQTLQLALRGAPEQPAAHRKESVADELMARASARDATLSRPLFIVGYTPDPSSFISGEDPVAVAQQAPGLMAMKVSARENWTSLEDYDAFACNLRIDLLSSATRDELEAAFSGLSGSLEFTPAAVANDKEEDRQAAGVERRTMRVDAERIDALVHTIDELIVAKNALSQLAAEASLQSGEALGQRIRDHQAAIGRLTARMHSAVTSMRLVPIGPALRRLPRITREIGARLGKPVEFILDCEEIEADKTIVDAISEPLLHIVRNAMDHGVETPAERRAAGKPERGRITLTAGRKGDQVVIRIEDDGRGVDIGRIRQVARDRALLPASTLDALDDVRALDLLFQPGFSTASQVSDLSGRGVGMDAVRTAVQKLGGSVNLATTQGAGTSVSLTFPLSMALTQIAVVECDGETFGVPMDDIIELARVRVAEIADVRRGRAFFLRERPVPVVTLESLLGRAERAAEDNMRVLVVDSGAEVVGVSVARLVERIEAVVSPAGGILTGMRGFSGTTLAGNGSVLIVLNLPELIG